MRWIRRMKYWMHMRREQDALREELAHHRELLSADFTRSGLPHDDAERAARRKMGDETFMREESRNIWWSPRIDALAKDWRYAWRGLRRSPVFTLVAVLSLGIGIGANTAIFSVIHTLLLARLPISHASELVQIKRELGARGTDERFSRDEFEALSQTGLPLTHFATGDVTFEIGATSDNARFDAVDGNYFPLLNIQPARGRLISPADDATAAPVMVVTEEFWRTTLNADTAVVGRVLKLNGQPFSVIGVTKSGFAGLRFPSQTEIMVPVRSAAVLGLVREVSSRQLMFAVVGRFTSEAKLRANEQITRLWRQCCAAGERVTNAGSMRTPPASGIVIADISRGIPQPKVDLRKHYTRIFIALMAGVGILLLAACMNVANLLMARSQARAGELAVRLALGASRTRLVMQLIIESLQLSLLGAVVGLFMASWGTSVLTHINVGDLNFLIEPRIAPAVFCFTLLVSLFSGIVFGVFPALRVLGADLITPLKQSGRRTTAGRRGLLDRGLVALQMALALLLVSGASLLVQTLQNLQTTSSGFDANHRYEITIETRHTTYEHDRMTNRLADEILRRVRVIPGVSAASFGSMVPIYGGRGVTASVNVHSSERSQSEMLSGDEPEISFVAVTPDYFRSMGMKIRSGRDLGRTGTAVNSTSVNDVVVNEEFVAKYFSGRDPLGQLFESVTNGDSIRVSNHIVGVVAGAKYTSLRAPLEPMFYAPVKDGQWPYLVLTFHSASNESVVARRVMAAIDSIAPGIETGDPTSLSSSIASALVRERISAGLATTFGAIALCLVAVGLYGVMLYQVTERTAEIGIRVALGARPGSIASLVAGQSFKVVAVGLVVGTPLALAAGRAVASQLYGVPPISVQALFVGVVALTVVAMLATAIPVYRAIGLDPVRALRAD